VSAKSGCSTDAVLGGKLSRSRANPEKVFWPHSHRRSGRYEPRLIARAIAAVTLV
jgi:hypothetical protein